MSSTPRTSTRSSGALRSRTRSNSGTRARRPTSPTGIDRTRASPGSGVCCVAHPQLPRQIFTFAHLPPGISFIPRKPLAFVMAHAPGRSASSVPSEAWAMLGMTDLEASTCWDFPTQSAGHLKAGDASFNGVTPARCAENLVRRYTRPGEIVVDPMAGSGTIGDVANGLGRRAVSFDLAPRRSEILRADARALPLTDDSAALVVIDSPYSDNIAYSADPRCLGRISCRDP